MGDQIENLRLVIIVNQLQKFLIKSHVRLQVGGVITQLRFTKTFRGVDVYVLIVIPLDGKIRVHGGRGMLIRVVLIVQTPS